MLWTIMVVLVILWLLGFSLHVAGGLIHLLLVVALIVLVFNLVSGRRGLFSRKSMISCRWPKCLSSSWRRRCCSPYR